MKTGLIGKPGPFRVIRDDTISSAMGISNHPSNLNKSSATNDRPSRAPRRRYLCPKYDTCLNLAAALNWDNFTCRGCCGEVDETLLWRAYQEARHDQIASAVCELPQIEIHASEGDASESENRPRLKLVKTG
jgi:predicted Fe-S protein YdhL (DUF1289 family)